MSTVFTGNQIVTWLAGVHADPEMDAHAFKVAFALSQLIDTVGFVRSSVLGKLDQAGDVIGQLVARGHLSADKRRKVDGVRLVVRPSKTKRVRRQKTAEVVPFPSGRRQLFIHKQAERMAGLTPAQADAHLRHQLKVQAQTMRRRAIADEAIGREIKSIESAIKLELWKCILTQEKPA